MAFGRTQARVPAPVRASCAAYHRDALEAYQGSLEVFAEIGGAQNEAILHHKIGGVYDEAIGHYHKALKLVREIGGSYEEARSSKGSGTSC